MAMRCLFPSWETQQIHKHKESHKLSLSLKVLYFLVLLRWDTHFNFGALFPFFSINQRYTKLKIKLFPNFLFWCCFWPCLSLSSNCLLLLLWRVSLCMGSLYAFWFCCLSVASVSLWHPSELYKFFSFYLIQEDIFWFMVF